MNFQQGVLNTPVLDPVSEEITAAAEFSANFITVDQVRVLAEQGGLTGKQVEAVVNDYADAQITSLKVVFAGIALFALLALAYVHRLSKKVSGLEDADQAKAESKADKHRRKQTPGKE